MHDLGSLGGPDSAARDINVHGQVVGATGVGAFLWTPTTPGGTSGEMVGLNSLIDPLSGWELFTAAAINDAGQITGDGRIGGEYHAFLLTPVPEPSTLALLAVCLLHILRRNSRHLITDYSAKNERRIP